MDIVSYVLGYKSGAKGGITPSGEVSITENGTYDVTEAASAVVNVLVGPSDIYTYKSGSFTATSAEQTVTHGCGEVPDILIVYSSKVPAGSRLYFGIGFSTAMLAALGGGYLSQTYYTAATGTGLISTSTNKGVDQSGHASNYVNYGGIRDVTSNEFTLGATGDVGLNVDIKYQFIAICGTA